MPYKVCSYDCIYCQLGRTTKLTSTPERLVGASDVIREVEYWLKQGGTADYITFAGSGEPTLNVELGEMIRAIKRLTGIPLAVITNGSLLSEPEVRESILPVDVLLPSLDAGTDCTFRVVNRPAREISFHKVVEGLEKTAREFSGSTWLEIMFVAGVNDSDNELYAIREIVQRIRPDKLQINTVMRPSRSGDARRVSDERLRRACEILGGSAEIVGGGEVEPVESSRWRQVEDELVQILSRRPCTLSDIVAISGRSIHEVTKHLHHLVREGIVEQVGEVDPYYRCVMGG